MCGAAGPKGARAEQGGAWRDGELERLRPSRGARDRGRAGGGGVAPGRSGLPAGQTASSGCCATSASCWRGASPSRSTRRTRREQCEFIIRDCGAQDRHRRGRRPARQGARRCATGSPASPGGPHRATRARAAGREGPHRFELAEVAALARLADGRWRLRARARRARHARRARRARRDASAPNRCSPSSTPRAPPGPPRGWCSRTRTSPRPSAAPCAPWRSTKATSSICSCRWRTSWRQTSWVRLPGRVRHLVFAGTIAQIKEDLVAVRPTFMAGVPRIFEKFYAGVHRGWPGAGSDRAPSGKWAAGRCARGEPTRRPRAPGPRPASATGWPTSWSSPSCARASASIAAAS